MDDKNLNCVFIAANHPSVQKDPSLCANCGHCLSVCTEQIGLMHMAAGNNSVLTAANAQPFVLKRRCM